MGSQRSIIKLDQRWRSSYSGERILQGIIINSHSSQVVLFEGWVIWWIRGENYHWSASCYWMRGWWHSISKFHGWRYGSSAISFQRVWIREIGEDCRLTSIDNHNIIDSAYLWRKFESAYDVFGLSNKIYWDRFSWLILHNFTRNTNTWIDFNCDSDAWQNWIIRGSRCQWRHRRLHFTSLEKSSTKTLNLNSIRRNIRHCSFWQRSYCNALRQSN